MIGSVLGMTNLSVGNIARHAGGDTNDNMDGSLIKRRRGPNSGGARSLLLSNTLPAYLFGASDQATTFPQDPYRMVTIRQASAALLPFHGA